jgi:hypothetical protein
LLGFAVLELLTKKKIPPLDLARVNFNQLTPQLFVQKLGNKKHKAPAIAG